MLAELSHLVSSALEERLPTDPLVWISRMSGCLKLSAARRRHTPLRHYGDIEALATFGFVRTSCRLYCLVSRGSVSWEYHRLQVNRTFQFERA